MWVLNLFPKVYVLSHSSHFPAQYVNFSFFLIITSLIMALSPRCVWGAPSFSIMILSSWRLIVPLPDTLYLQMFHTLIIQILFHHFNYVPSCFHRLPLCIYNYSVIIFFRYASALALEIQLPSDLISLLSIDQVLAYDSKTTKNIFHVWIGCYH